MDNLTEENVMKSVMQKMKDKTVIAIAHRLNSIAGFDRIILFKEGRIVGQGTFEELLHTDSYFMDLYNANVNNCFFRSKLVKIQRGCCSCTFLIVRVAVH